MPGITAFPTSPSMISGFGASPVQFVIEGEELPRLAGWADEIKNRISSYGGFGNVQTNLYLNKPQLEVSIDRERASDLGVSVRSIASALQILLGGLDLSTFKLGGETYDVMAQLEQSERNDPRDLLELYVRGNNGQLISLSAGGRDARDDRSARGPPLRPPALGDGLGRSRDPDPGRGLEVATSIAKQVLPEGPGSASSARRRSSSPRATRCCSPTGSRSSWSTWCWRPSSRASCTP